LRDLQGRGPEEQKGVNEGRKGASAGPGIPTQKSGVPKHLEGKGWVQLGKKGWQDGG